MEKNNVKTDWQDDIDSILDEFNFEKVHQTMQALDWHWIGNPDIPTIGELRREARKRLKEAIESYKKHPEQGGRFNCGGFEATAYPDGYLRLAFVVSEWVSPIDLDETFSINED